MAALEAPRQFLPGLEIQEMSYVAERLKTPALVTFASFSFCIKWKNLAFAPIPALVNSLSTPHCPGDTL
jgi:hypothetical protein